MNNDEQMNFDFNAPQPKEPKDIEPSIAEPKTEYKSKPAPLTPATPEKKDGATNFMEICTVKEYLE